MSHAATSSQPEDIFVDVFTQVFGFEKAQLLIPELEYQSGHAVTDLGHKLLGERGLDPYLEDIRHALAHPLADFHGYPKPVAGVGLPAQPLAGDRTGGEPGLPAPARRSGQTR